MPSWWRDCINANNEGGSWWSPQGRHPLYPVGDSRILLVISETEYPRLVPLGKHSLLINVDLGNLTSLAVTLTLENLPATGPRSSNEQLNPNLPQRIGNHSAKSNTHVPAQQPPAQHHPLYFQKRRVHRYNENSPWHPSPVLQPNSFPPREFTQAGCHRWGIQVGNPQPEGDEHVL